MRSQNGTKERGGPDLLPTGRDATLNRQNDRQSEGGKDIPNKKELALYNFYIYNVHKKTGTFKMERLTEVLHNPTVTAYQKQVASGAVLIASLSLGAGFLIKGRDLSAKYTLLAGGVGLVGIAGLFYQDRPLTPVHALRFIEGAKSAKPTDRTPEGAIAYAHSLLLERGVASTQVESHHSTQMPPLLQHLEQSMFEREGQLQAAYTQHKNWQCDEVASAFDNYFRVAFAISIYTLEEARKNCPEGETIEATLAGQKTYHFHTFFRCPWAYYLARRESEWQNGPSLEFTGWVPKRRQGDIAPAYVSLFYQPGRIQNEWRELFNCYSACVRTEVPERVLEQRDKRFTKWSTPDRSARSFLYEPGTLPT